MTATRYGKGGALPPGVALVRNAAGEDEQVAHPAHYNSLAARCRSCCEQIECIDVAEAMSFNAGNVVKYLWRSGLKPGADALTDLRKARFYLDREITRLDRDEP